MASTSPPEIRGDRVVLRPVDNGDEATLREIFSDSSVARWWGDPDKSVADTIHAQRGQTSYIIETAGRPIGMIQSQEEDDPSYRSAGIDLAIRSPWQGKGLGPDAIRTLARYLTEQRGHHRLTIDPAADNVYAIRAYERIGFKRVGIMRKYELGRDGRWRDGLLMDMLADELRQ